jgi:hypothetical protein
MTRPSGPSSARTALFIYLSMIVAVALALVMSVALQAVEVFPQAPSQPVFDVMPLALATAAALVFLAVRRRLPERRSGESEDDWWRANLPAALTLWATAEGAALVGAVFHLVTGSSTALAATALGLALLAFSTPTALANRAR